MPKTYKPLARCGRQDPAEKSSADARRCVSYLRRVRHALGLTVLQMAEQLDVPERSYRSWEAGTHLPRLDIYFRLRDLLSARQIDSNGKLLVARAVVG